MRYVMERAARVLEFCRQPRTSSEIRAEFAAEPKRAIYALQNLVKSGHIRNILQDGTRPFGTQAFPGLYQTQDAPTPPIKYAAPPKPPKAEPKPAKGPNSVWQLGRV